MIFLMIRIQSRKSLFFTETPEDLPYVAIERGCKFPPFPFKSSEPCFKDDFIETRVTAMCCRDSVKLIELTVL